MSLGAYHHNRVRTLIRDPLVSLFDLMNTCILNPYISQGLGLLLCCIMQWLWWIVYFIWNFTWLDTFVTEGNSCDYLLMLQRQNIYQIKKPLFSVSISNNSTVLVLIRAVLLFQWEENMAGCGSASQRIRKWCHVRGIAHAYIWKRTAVLPLVQICFICPVRSKGLQPASCKISVRFFI